MLALLLQPTLFIPAFDTTTSFVSKDVAIRNEFAVVKNTS